MLLFPNRLVAGQKILALLTVVRIHLRDFFIANFFIYFWFSKSRKVFDPQGILRVTLIPVVLLFESTLIVWARDSRPTLS